MVFSGSNAKEVFSSSYVTVYISESRYLYFIAAPLPSEETE